MKQKVYGYIVWVTDTENFISEYQFANDLKSEVWFLIGTDDGAVCINTTVEDTPRMAQQFGLNAAYKWIETEIPVYWEDKSDSE